MQNPSKMAIFDKIYIIIIIINYYPEDRVIHIINQFW